MKNVLAKITNTPPSSDMQKKELLHTRIGKMSDRFQRSVGLKRPLTWSEEWRRKFAIPDEMSDHPFLVFTVHKSKRSYLFDGVVKAKHTGLRVKFLDDTTEDKAGILFDQKFVDMLAIDLRETPLEEIYLLMKRMSQATVDLNEGREMEYSFDVMKVLAQSAEELRAMPGNYFFNVHIVPALDENGKIVQPNPAAYAEMATSSIPQYSDTEEFEKTFRWLQGELIKRGYFRDETLSFLPVSEGQS